MIDDDLGEWADIVTIHDLERALARGAVEQKTVADIATTTGLLVTFPHEPMWMALRRLGARDLGQLPVLAREGSRQLVGVVRRYDITRVYNQAIGQRTHHQHRAEMLRLGRPDGTTFVHIKISPQSPVVGKRISKITLPQECLIVSVQRGRKQHVVHGYTVLQGGDRVTVFANQDCIPLVRQCLMGESA